MVPSSAAERRRRHTADLLGVLPPSEPFDVWRASTGALAPDFARLPARTQLWSPVDGVRTAGEWPARRALLRARWRRWLTGPLPPAPRRTPVSVTSVRTEGRAEVRELVVGAPWGIRARLLLPRRPPGPARDVPVYLLQSSHPGWAQAALDRGWGACLVSAADGDDDTEAVERWFARPPVGRLAWRAWALSRVMDALAGQPGVDARRVLVGGHSRNGKTALLAAAFDDRFAGVVSSSSGVLGAIPARLCTDRHGGEGVELLTRHFPGWYGPALRWFSGREHRLPTDTHELLALAAPRPVLVSVGVQDPVERVPAARAAVAAAREAWALLGADGPTLALRPGGHSADAAAVQAQLDWAQAGIERPRRRPALPVPRRPLDDELPTAVRWPADRPAGPLLTGRELRTAIDEALGRLQPAPGVAATLLAAPAGATERGVVLWLGAACAATGWRLGYEQAEPLPEQLAADGWGVACADPVGTGGRHAERPPSGSSPLGSMAADAAAVAADALRSTGADRVWLAGYGTGALVAAHLAALGQVPLAGAVLVAPSCGEPALRRRPRYWLADLLATLVDVPSLVLDPVWDPEAPPGAVAAACRAAGVERRRLTDWHRLSAATRRSVVDWLGSVAAR